MAVSVRKSDLVVRRDDVPLLGISGHQLASLPSAAEVDPQGERGPYTIVSWNGRLGFVLTDDLCDPEELTEADAESEPSEAAGAGEAAGPAWLLTAFLGLSTLAGATGAIYVFLLA